MNYLAQMLINYVHDHKAALLFRSAVFTTLVGVFWYFTIRLIETH
jgi:hypothetical protein